MILRVVAYWIFSVMAIGLLIVLWDVGQGPWGPLFDPARYHLLREKYTSMLIASLLVLPVLVADAWIQSSRYAGPIFRLRRCLRELAAGKPVEHIRFRKRDHWASLAGEFNELVDYVERLKAKANDRATDGSPEGEPAGELESAGVS